MNITDEQGIRLALFCRAFGASVLGLDRCTDLTQCPGFARHTLKVFDNFDAVNYMALFGKSFGNKPKGRRKIQRI